MQLQKHCARNSIQGRSLNLAKLGIVRRYPKGKFMKALPSVSNSVIHQCCCRMIWWPKEAHLYLASETLSHNLDGMTKDTQKHNWNELTKRNNCYLLRDINHYMQWLLILLVLKEISGNIEILMSFGLQVLFIICYSELICSNSKEIYTKPFKKFQLISSILKMWFSKQLTVV